MAAAFDEVRFGRENTLDLRATLPTGAVAAQRAESFLRERQVSNAREVLVITGRGNQSTDGVAVVRPAIAALLAKLRRRGVVAAWQEHTPGSFVIVPATISALLEAPKRTKDAADIVADHAGLAGLAAETRDALRQLAVGSLQALGAPASESFVHDEMLRQFSALGRSIPPSPDREARLRAAALMALDELNAAT